MAEKRFASFTEEQQAAFSRLTTKQKAYVEFRGMGNGKAQAYRMAGYESGKASQAAYIMERDVPIIPELIRVLQGQKTLREITMLDSAINKKVDALALQESADNLLEVINGADGETARRIKFYRDIIAGKIKSIKRITKKDADGNILETKEEEIYDIETKIKARKELDKILGLTQMPDLSKLQVGDITINIVDASKQDELQDERNTVELDPDNIEIVSEETVVEDGKAKATT